jgi:hypothetical protein
MSSPIDTFKAPLLPVASYERKESLSTGSIPPPPSSSHRRTPSNSPLSRFPPRRALSLPLALLSLTLLYYTFHSRSASPSLDYASRRASGLVYTDRSSSLDPIRNRISSHAAGQACQDAPLTAGTVASMAGKTFSEEEIDARFERAARPLPVSATTKERLDYWENEAPGWEVEPADWVKKNLEVRLTFPRLFPQCRS